MKLECNCAVGESALCLGLQVPDGSPSSDMTMHSQEWITRMLELLVLHSAALLIVCYRRKHLRVVHRLRAVVDGSVVPYVTPQRCSGCQHVVLSPADSSQRGAEPPAGAICIPDKAIHHPHCSAQFRLLLQTASGSSEQLYIYVSVMRALETCLVALGARLKG